jgi:hypothetical protein
MGVAGGGYVLVACNDAAQTHRIDGVVVRLESVTPYAGQLNEWVFCARPFTRSFRTAVGMVWEVTSPVRWPQHPARRKRQQVRYYLTSRPARTPPETLLRLVRRHGHSENRLHWVRDVTLGEDACQVRAGRAPQVLAVLRNAVVGLLHQHHVPNLAATLRVNAWRGPAALLRLLGLKLCMTLPGMPAFQGRRPHEAG